jgi:hypothetical protein
MRYRLGKAKNEFMNSQRPDMRSRSQGYSFSLNGSKWPPFSHDVAIAKTVVKTRKQIGPAGLAWPNRPVMLFAGDCRIPWR